MNNKYFSPEETLAEITDKYPELISVLAGRGFAQLKDENKRQQFGSKISLKQAAELKGLNLEKLMKLIRKKIKDNDEEADVTVLENGGKRNSTGDSAGRKSGEKDVNVRENSDFNNIKVEGLLPCPVRVPFLEELKTVTTGMDKPVFMDLKAASGGLDWLKEKLSNDIKVDGLADIFISAGFDLFFDRRLMDRFRRQGVFKDVTGIESLNTDFKDNEIDLLDPEGAYSVLSVVPAVFLINREELGDRRMPETWADILSQEFADSVSLPVSDFDLFNAILINIYQEFGEKGIDKLGRSLLKSQHPAQMIKNGGRKKTGEAAVTIMPYFFTRMARRFSHLEFIWPADGAIISPIFMLTKKNSLPEVQPLVDFFASEKAGRILVEQGLFPSVLPEIDNNLPEEADFMWSGWDFLRNEDPGQLIEKLNARFEQQVKEVS